MTENGSREICFVAILYTTGLSLRKAVVIHSQLIFPSRTAELFDQPGDS